jgi:predicted ATPase
MSFIGREKEIAEVTRLLSTACIVTLTGPGGAGKTRLALQVGADLLDTYPDGVWWVELASLSNPALVLTAVASALDVPEQPGRRLDETLVRALPTKHLLLVLDNCDHLISACRDLADPLLRACPHLRILATSREALGVDGEVTYRVPSLQLPDLHRLPPPAELVQYEAIRLFAERAALSQPGFSVTASNAAAVAQICHRLDGIPLAIEFAAAQAKVLSVDQIGARLDDCFRLLTAGARKTLPRHQTLQATMDWSYDLLSEQERTVLRRLSVFAGGWTLDAAEAVCAGDGVESTDILDRLTQFVDKSPGAPRACGRAPGESSVSAATPPGPNRWRHKITVGRLVWTCRAIWRLETPVLASKMMRARNARRWGVVRAATHASSVRRCSSVNGTASGDVHMGPHHRANRRLERSMAPDEQLGHREAFIAKW